jgi:uncharacterized membrane protein
VIGTNGDWFEQILTSMRVSGLRKRQRATKRMQARQAPDKKKENGSELIVVGFWDQYRAVDVLNELKQRDWLPIEDLEKAIAVTLDETGNAKVQLSVDVSASETARWAGLWGSLLGVTLFLPCATALANAANQVFTGANGAANSAGIFPGAQVDPNWWRLELQISEDFLRDVGAVVKPGASAIFMKLLTQDISVVIRRLHNYASMVIHTTLSPEQDEKMRSFFALT